MHSLDSLFNLSQVMKKNCPSFIFVLNSDRRFHKEGVRLSEVIQRKFPMSTIQHAISKYDSLEELRLSRSEELFLWDGVACDYLKHSGKKLHRIGNLGLIHQKFPEEKNGNQILVATCTHAEYKSDKEHFEYFENIFKLFKDSGTELVIKPHPSEKHRHEFYRRVISLLSNKYQVEAKIENDFQMYLGIRLIITRASSIAEVAAHLGIPLMIYDLYIDGPSTVLEVNKDILSKAVVLRSRDLTITGSEILLAAKEKAFRCTQHDFQRFVIAQESLVRSCLKELHL
jgi:hypothetical protein